MSAIKKSALEYLIAEHEELIESKNFKKDIPEYAKLHKDYWQLRKNKKIPESL